MPLYFKSQARSGSIPPIGDYKNVFGGDSWSSNDWEEKAPISAGFFRIEKGEPCVYYYDYDDVKFFIEGECTMKDETGQEVVAKAGDVVGFKKGSTVTFTTEGVARAFFCGQRAKL